MSSVLGPPLAKAATTVSYAITANYSIKKLRPKNWRSSRQSVQSAGRPQSKLRSPDLRQREVMDVAIEEGIRDGVCLISMCACVCVCEMLFSRGFSG